MKKKKSGKGKVICITFVLVVLMVAIGFLFVPLFHNLKFGLDLQGGFEILYKVSSIDGSKMNSDKVTATYKTLSKRIDSLGVSEPEIVIEGEDKIRVKLAGVKDPEEARTQLSTVASLSFRDTEDNLLMSSDVLKAGGAKIGQDSSGRPAVALTIADKDLFYQVTNSISQKENNTIVIWLDYNELTDHYALPSKLDEISSQTVGASFGDDTLRTTLIAGIIAICAIALILMVVYHFAGFISSVSILIYTFLVFAVFWVVGGVLTLPGIAALVLGIGIILLEVQATQ